MGVWCYLVLREAAELVADHVEAVVSETPIAEISLCDQLGEAGLLGGRRTLGDQPADGLGAESGRGLLGQAQVMWADDLDLAHRNAADDPRKVLGEADLQDQPLALTEPAAFPQPLRPAMGLTQG